MKSAFDLVFVGAACCVLRAACSPKGLRAACWIRRGAKEVEVEDWIIPKEIEGSGPRGISRREALRRVGGGLAGLWLASLGIEPGRRPAEAATTDVDWAARHGLTAAEYQAEFARLAGQGYRLVDVSGYEAGGQARYAGIWERSGGPAWQARHGRTAAQLISWVLDNRPLDTVPGTSYAYSNFGYSVLGRIIERVTGEAYDGYVRRAVLAPSGIGDMAIAGNTLADRRPNEVRYAGQSGEDPYGMQVTRMDSHGGWLATAIDLVRFAVRVDGYATKPDILSAASITEMTTPSLSGSGYAKGWQVNSARNWWHTGSLPGTGSILVRTQSGFCWAALLNTRSLDSAFFGALDDTMWEVVREVSDWPGYDLF